MKTLKIGYLMQEGVPDIRQRPLSGAANHVVCVIQELKKAGHRVSLLARLDGKIYLSEDLDVFRPIEVRLFDRGISRLMERVIRRIQYELKLPYANLFESLRFAFACRQVLSECDIYFERMGWLGYGGCMAAGHLRIPLILEINGDHIDEFKSKNLPIRWSQQRLSLFLMKRLSMNVTHVIATGEGWRQKYIERWGVVPTKVSVVENGSALVNLLVREDLKAFQNSIIDESVQIVYCGGFEPWHGITILIHAVQRAIEQGCSLEVNLMGSGTQKDTLTKLIHELGLNNIFTFTGQVNTQELAQHLARADIGVSPYCGRVEYSGLKLLDYKAAGLAIIASGENNQPSILKHGYTGWIVPPCDEVSLSQAIITLAKNQDLRKKIGREARMEAEASHGWQHTAGQLVSLFNSIKSKKPESTARI